MWTDFACTLSDISTCKIMHVLLCIRSQIDLLLPQSENVEILQLETICDQTVQNQHNITQCLESTQYASVVFIH